MTKRPDAILLLLTQHTRLLLPLSKIICDYEQGLNFLCIATPYRMRYSWYLDDDDVFDSLGVLQLARMNWIDHPLVPGTDEDNEDQHAWSSKILRVKKELFAFCSMKDTFWVSDLSNQKMHSWQAISLPSSLGHGGGHTRCALLEERIYFFSPKQGAQIYDTQRKQWSKAKAMSCTNASTVVSAPDTSAFLFVGGRNRAVFPDASAKLNVSTVVMAPQQNDFERNYTWEISHGDITKYDTKEDKFSHVTNLCTPRAHPACGWISPNTLLVLSGYGNDKVTTDGMGHSGQPLNEFEIISNGRRIQRGQWFGDSEWSEILKESHWNPSSEVMIDPLRKVVYSFVNTRCYAHTDTMHPLSCQRLPWDTAKSTIWNVVS